MKKLLLCAFAVIGFAVPASAAITVTDNGDGTATVTGTAADDHIALEEWDAGFAYVLDVNAGYEVVGILDLNDFDFVFVNGLAGNDIIENRAVPFFFADGGAGNDDLYGSELTGGFDDLMGGEGDDFLYGGLGGDNLNGGDGGDYLFGGSWCGAESEPSTLVGGAGEDTIVGTAFDDLIVAGDGEYDFVDCAGGNDFGNPFASFDIGLDELVNCD